MTQEVWKFTLDMSEKSTRIDAPLGAKFISVQRQGAGVVAWAIVDPSFPIDPVTVERHGTGWPIREPADGLCRTYIATIVDGAFVWHFFRLGCL